MTPAELKTVREACGLPQSWLAHRAQVNERTVRYWESGKSSVPDDVAAWLERRLAAHERWMRDDPPPSP